MYVRRSSSNMLFAELRLYFIQRPSTDLGKSLYLDQRVPQHESFYHIGLESLRIKISNIKYYMYIDFFQIFSKTVFG